MGVFANTRTYLDWAAAAPVLPAARRAFMRALTNYGNPSSPHQDGRVAKDILEDARARIARLAGTKRDAVVFTSGATEANALAIRGVVHACRAANSGVPHVLYLPSVHASVCEAIAQLAEEGVATQALTLRAGMIDLEALASQIRPETMLVIVDAVCGETGTLFDVREVRRTLDKVQKGKAPILLHADASQAPFVESFELTRLGADTLTLDAQKVGGVRGIGALIRPSRVSIEPLMRGGGQERGLRPGTPSPALASAFAEALEHAQAGRSTFLSRAKGMREELATCISSNISNVYIHEGKEQAPHIFNASFVGRDTDYLVALLDEVGFSVSTRSACDTNLPAGKAGADGSRAVLALTGSPEQAAATLRVSWGPSTSPRAIRHFGTALVTAVRFLDSNALY